MKALVTISHKNSARTLRRCLACLQSQDYKDFKVVITDAGSTDGSIPIAESFLADSRFVLKVLPGCTEGEGEAWAIENYPAQVVLFTNSDIYTPRNWISLHMAWHDAGYELVGGKQFYVGDSYDFAWSSSTPKDCYSTLTENMSLGFTNCSTTLAFYNKVGGIKPLLTVGTDMDYFLRGVLADAKIALDPRILVYHDHRLGSFYLCFRKAFNYGVNQITLLRLHYKSRYKWKGYPRAMSPKNLLPWFDWVNTRNVWLEQRDVFYTFSGKNQNPLDFILVRHMAVQLGFRLGAIVGMLRKPSFDSLSKRRLSYKVAR